MSKVHAVTEDIYFKVKTASFTPLPVDLLIDEFAKWMHEKAKENNFIIWSCSMQGASQDYNA